MRYLLRTFITPLILAVLLPVLAQAGGPDEVAEIDVLPGWRMADGTHMAAIRIRLADGWKTYWRAPGDAGIPPSFDWSGSKNLTGMAFHWPVPDVFEQNGMQTIGYKHQLILPVNLVPRAGDRVIVLKGSINLGVCRDICVPMQAELSARLPGDAHDPDPIIQRALTQRPDTGQEAGLARAECEVEAISDGLRLTAHLSLPRIGPDEVVVVETDDPSVWVSEAEISRSGGVLMAKTDLVAPGGAPFLLERSEIRLTVLAAGRGVDVRGCAGVN